jgi:Helix-turn-helix domain
MVQITRGYRTELDLNNQQITACKKHAGAARYAYNWGLKRKQEVYQTTGRSISAMELHREFLGKGETPVERGALADRSHDGSVKLPSAKQEPDTNYGQAIVG